MKKHVLVAMTGTFLSLASFAAIDGKQVVAQMAPEQVSRLALMSQMGSCKMTAPVGASYKYKLTYWESGKLINKYFYSPSFVPVKFSGSQFIEAHSIQMQAAPLSSKAENWLEKMTNELFVNKAHATITTVSMPAYNLSVYSITEAKSLQYTAGNFIKGLVASNKCGTISFETYKKSITQMNSLEFYRDPLNNKIRCSELGFVKKIRSPNSCAMMDVRSELPEKTCQLLYQIKTQKTRNSRIAGTEIATVSSGGSGGVTLVPFTEALRTDFAISHVLSADPELASFTLSAEVPSLDEALPVSTLEFLDTRAPKTVAEFNALSAADKAEVLNVLATIDAVQGSSEYSNFTSKVTGLSTVKSAALSYAAANPSLIVEGYAVPKKYAVEAQISTLTTPIRNLGVTLNFNLNCLEMAVAAAPVALAL